MNIDISVMLENFQLKLSMHVLKVLLERSMSRIFNIGLGFEFMLRNGELFVMVF